MAAGPATGQNRPAACVDATMRALRRILLIAVLAVPACDLLADPPQPGPPRYMRIVSGNHQTGPVNQYLPDPLVVELTDSARIGVPDHRVRWWFYYIFEPGEDSLVAYLGATFTDRRGRTGMRVRLGERPGTYSVLALSDNAYWYEAEDNFTLTAVPED